MIKSIISISIFLTFLEKFDIPRIDIALCLTDSKDAKINLNDMSRPTLYPLLLYLTSIFNFSNHLAD